MLQAWSDVQRDVLGPHLCPVLMTLSPGVPGVVDVAPDGDVVGGGALMDCPWYDQPPAKVPERVLVYTAD